MSAALRPAGGGPPGPDPNAVLVGLLERSRAQLDNAILGYREPFDLMLIAAVAGGHVLLEGPPGVAKTLMASAVARVLGASFRRIQFTPDTTPAEITGRTVLKGGEPVFLPGAAFTNILLADEINRTPPRTQAAMLEAMQERHVTVDGRTQWLPTPFMVVATQNPYEQTGIFPLPESQLDRFLFKINIDYVSAVDEQRILELPHRGLMPDVLGDIVPLLDVSSLDAAQVELDATPVSPEVTAFVVDVVRRTRGGAGVVLGASPRASIHLLSAAKAHARLAGRPSVVREDVVDMAPFVLTHRIITDGFPPRDVVALAVDGAVRAAG